MESERTATDGTGTIGIIGAGNIGQALARTALRAGREVVIANSRGPESLAPVVAGLGTGVSAGTVGETAAAGIVAIAVPWASVPAAVTGLHWDGQTVIDATNAWNAELGGQTRFGTLDSGETLAMPRSPASPCLSSASGHTSSSSRLPFSAPDNLTPRVSFSSDFHCSWPRPPRRVPPSQGGARLDQVGQRFAGNFLVRGRLDRRVPPQSGGTR